MAQSEVQLEPRVLAEARWEACKTPRLSLGPLCKKCALVIFHPSDSDGLRGRLACRTCVAWLCWHRCVPPPPASLLHSLISLLSDDPPPPPPAPQAATCVHSGGTVVSKKKKKKSLVVLLAVQVRKSRLGFFVFFFVPCQGKKKVLCKDAGSSSER